MYRPIVHCARSPRLLPMCHRVMSTTRALETYGNEGEYLGALSSRGCLPQGFKVGTSTFQFSPAELSNRKASMTLTLITLDRPTPSFSALFTTNAFPGAPVIVGRQRVANSPHLQAVVINNKISNVCAPGGIAASEALCVGAASVLGLASPTLVLPCSTGIIGWGLPVPDMVAALPATQAALQGGTVVPAAKGICTTDLYPKVRSMVLPGGARIVGIAKGAGMVEPGLATMLVYILTDAVVSREELRGAVAAAVGPTFNSLSIDSDMSTSDTLVALASNTLPLQEGKVGRGAALQGFTSALTSLCALLSEDIVRNGEGVAHVIRVTLSNAPSLALARAVGKAVVNSPLFKCAVAGNDPNVGRLVAAIGKCIGGMPREALGGLDMAGITLTMGGLTIFSKGVFSLNPATEAALVKHLKEAQLWESAPQVAEGAQPRATAGSRAATYAAADVSYATPINFPPHERCVEVGVDLGCTGGVSTVILGSDLTHEYVAENGDYRS